MVSTSRTEVVHLSAAIVVLGLVFAIAMTKGQGIGSVVPSGWILFVSMAAVVTGFLPHELAHKLVAQRYGLAAEFRGSWPALALSLFIVLATSLTAPDGRGIVLAAPGAVMLSGAISYRTHGIVSVVGPGVNILVAALAWPFAVTVNPETDRVAQLFHTIALVNAVLAVFNLVPFGPLDGRKVWWWHRGVYVLAMGTAVVFLVALLVVLGTPAT